MTADEILESMRGYMSGWDTSEGSVTYDMIRPVAEEAAKLYDAADEILKNAFAMTAEGEWLDKKVSEQGIARKEAQYAEGTLTITGTAGAVVRAGSKAASGDVMYSVTESGILPQSGEITLSAMCDTPGSRGNAAAGTVIRFPVSYAGLTAVTNSEAFTGGTDEETDDELRQRYFDKVSKPHTGGNAYDYQMWALAAGAGSAKVVPLWRGAGTVKVVISDPDNQPAPAELTERVGAYIEELRPVGADVTVVSSTALEIRIAANVTHSGDAQTVTEEIRTAIVSYLSGTATENGIVSYAKISAIILSADSVEDHTGLTVNGGTANITVGDENVPVLVSLEI